MTAADAQPFAILGNNFYGVILAVRSQACRRICERVLAAKLILDFRECITHFGNLEREERASAGCVSDALKNFIATASTAVYVSAYRVNDHLGTLCHLHSFFARDVALVVVPVA